MDKPKRTRRTKAQMEAARAAEAPVAALAEVTEMPVAVSVRMLKDIQMPRDYLVGYHDVRDPKLAQGDIILMKRDWAERLISAGKVERI